MADHPLHVAVLQMLGRKALERRESHLEQMARGLNEREYMQAVGRAAESKALAEEIEELLRRIRQDEIDFDEEGTDDEDIGVRAPARRTRRLTRTHARG